jgi:hypothetical protein
MASESILTMRVGSCRDLLEVRHRARQVAKFLSFSPQDCIAIAAGAFMVAQQALKLLRCVDIGFMLVDWHLRVVANPVRAGKPAPAELLTLVKPLPASNPKLAVSDVSWLIRQLQQLAPVDIKTEVSKQNQEVLMLLSSLHDGAVARDLGPNPSAA